MGSINDIFLKIENEDGPLRAEDVNAFYKRLKRSLHILHENKGSFNVDKSDPHYRKKITNLRFLKNYLLAISVEKHLYEIN